MPSLTRRRLLASGGALTAAAVGYGGVEAAVGPTPTVSFPAPDSGEWPTDRRGPARRAAAPEASPPESAPRTDWTVDTPPVRGAGVSVVVAEQTVVAGTGQGVTAHDVATGDRRWTAPVGGADLCFGGDSLYCSDGDAVVALGRERGDPRWRESVGAPVTALLAGESVVVVATERDLLALDTADGRRLWRRSGAGAVSASLSGADGSLYLARPGEVLRFDPRTGWDALGNDGPAAAGRASVDGGLLAPALTGDGRGVVGSWTVDGDPGVAAFGVDDLDERWRADGFPPGTVSTPAVTDGVGVAERWANEAEVGGLVGIDTADGSVLWSREDYPGGGSVTDPVVAGTLALAGRGEGDGVVLAVDAESGDVRWSVSLDDGVGDEAVYRVVPAGERVFAVTWSGRLVCLR